MYPNQCKRQKKPVWMRACAITVQHGMPRWKDKTTYHISSLHRTSTFTGTRRNNHSIAKNANNKWPSRRRLQFACNLPRPAKHLAKALQTGFPCGSAQQAPPEPSL
eukprot:TRINITY_DN75396_c0_g1_i1.p1 TRINITY_DN75396_c0_g1~~TRINITY_DN75396_c0_g1_i1.p1  ORF type:complete len:106 (+),score=1.02 TRINITY_DN75396_c0_g1_i1:87-404(+)